METRNKKNDDVSFYLMSNHVVKKMECPLQFYLFNECFPTLVAKSVYVTLFLCDIDIQCRFIGMIFVAHIAKIGRPFLIYPDLVPECIPIEFNRHFCSTPNSRFSEFKMSRRLYFLFKMFFFEWDPKFLGREETAESL